ncbi:DUF502 domain-containing protein [Candidatus Liberibacter americanus]|uniref:Transporter n=1 Tax=Candidatus Liberibacter americanus str. Sao Paulo TaxID=1261131 RepID=U6B592_9HYPH|nr:hypothetical protein lam_734 [Candidatus Liberibacter americanus str. Sao Paulo]
MRNKSNNSFFVKSIRNNFLTGLAICAPTAITIWITLSSIYWVDSFIVPYIPNRYNPEYYFDVYVPGLGLLIVLISISIIGFIGRNLMGKFIISLIESILNNTPVVKSLYKSTKQIFKTVFKEDAGYLKNACLVEYPTDKRWSLCFLTTDVKGELKEKFSEHNFNDMVTVFIPPTPLPTAGMLVFVPRKKVIMLKMTSEDAAKMLISGGLIIPDYIKYENEEQGDNKY